MSEYNEAIKSLEALAISKMRAIINSLQNQPSLVLREFQKHYGLLSKKSVAKFLVAEKDALLVAVNANLDSTQKSLDKAFSKPVI